MNQVEGSAMVGFLLRRDINRDRLISSGIERTRKLEDVLRDMGAPIIRIDSHVAKLCQQVEGI